MVWLRKDIDNTPATGFYFLRGIHITCIETDKWFNYIFWIIFVLWSLTFFIIILASHNIVELNYGLVTGLFYEIENEGGSESDYRLMRDQVALCFYNKFNNTNVND